MGMLSPYNNNNSLWPRRTLTSELMDDFFSDFDRMVDGFMRPTTATTQNFVPSCDISETKDHFLVCFDMPGVKKDNVKVEVDGNQLMIAGERFTETHSDEGVIRTERRAGKFQRVFTLPSVVDADRIQAHYEDGVLNIAIPKSEKAKGKTIEVQSGKSGFFSKLLGSKKSDEVKDVKSVKAS